MDDIRIDQLRLRLSGLPEREARRLVRLLTEQLAAVELPGHAARSIGALHIEVGSEHRSAEAISHHVVGEVVRQLHGGGPKAGR
jgi:hypothetical protein